MALERTGPDSLACLHLGAASHDAAQTDPDLSLGDHLSSTLAPSLAPAVSVVALGSGQLTIQRIDGENGTGTGTITATGVNDITWLAPGGSAGPAVTILNGETRMLHTNGDPNKFIIVTRDNANDLTTSANVSIVVVYPSAMGFADVDAAEQAAGSVKYRALGYENLNSVATQNLVVQLVALGTQRISATAFLPASGAGTIEIASGNFNDWPASGHCLIHRGTAVHERVYYSGRTSTVLTVPAVGRGLGVTSEAVGQATDTVDAVPPIELAIEEPASQPSGAFDAPADEDTAPSGVTFSNPLLVANALTPPDKDPGETFAVRAKRIVVAGSTNEQNIENGWTVQYEAA